MQGTYLDVPSPLPQSLELELVRNLGGVHGVGQILLVGKDEEEGIPQFVFTQHSLEFLACFGHTIAIVRVDDEDDPLGILEV